MRALWLGLLACLGSAALLAGELPELELLDEYPVQGMPAGNLSGLAWCSGALYGVSDREDDRLYRLLPEERQLRAEAELFSAPAPRDMGLPWGLKARNWISGKLRGGELDFEGLSCDAEGNRYLVSESRVGVLRLPAGASQGEWLHLPRSLLRQARASGMLLHFNALLEGIAVEPGGERLWLAAERQRRGLLVVHRNGAQWGCKGGCVLFSEGGLQAAPQPLEAPAQARDFSDLAYFSGKLFSLERQGHRICRRDADNGIAERCWSFAEAALQPSRRYGAQRFGMAEGLVIDAEGAWIGLDNGRHVRNDGEARPIVWRFAAPGGGWGGR